MTSGVTCNLKGPRNSPIQNAATRVVFTLAPCRWYQVVRISETSMQFYGYLFASSFHGSNSKGPKVCPLDMCFSWIFVFANSRWTQFSKKSQKKIRTSRPQSPVPSHHKRVWLHRYLATKPPCFPAVLQPSTSSTCFSWAYPTLGAVEFKFQAGPQGAPAKHMLKLGRHSANYLRALPVPEGSRWAVKKLVSSEQERRKPCALPMNSGGWLHDGKGSTTSNTGLNLLASKATATP